MTSPTLKYEKKLWNTGCNLVAGVDEVGRGALAGPVVAGAVIFSTKHKPISGVRDSKQLSKKQKDSLEKLIINQCFSYAVGEASAQEIDNLGIAAATALAMERALKRLELVNHVLIDGRQFGDKSLLDQYEKTFIVKGDSLSYSIAAASILAKVYRDKLMTQMDNQICDFDFSNHVGYGTLKHREVLKKRGPTVIHRHSFISKILDLND